MMSCSAVANQFLVQLISDFVLKDNCFACDQVCATLSVRAFEAVSQKSSKNSICNFAVIAREYLWEVLHSKSWVDVPLQYRDAFSLFSIIVAYTISDQTLNLSITSDKFRLNVMSIIDSGILLGSASYHPILLQLVERIGGEMIEYPNLLEVKGEFSIVIDRFSQRINLLPRPISMRIFLSKSEDVSVRASSVERIRAPHLLQFLEAHLLLSRPVVLTECMEEWSALKKWRNLEYYAQVAGSRSVPVEIGSSYLSSDYNQQLMTLTSFISRYIIGIERDPQETGYLAQHRLLDQIPQLMRDIITPDYCALLTPEDEQEVDPSASTTGSVDDVLVNAWLGPNTTVSPLHHDPYHNLLAQVVGYKYVRLYDPSQSVFLYPMTDRKSNNSQVDLTAVGEDGDQFPLSRSGSCCFTETVLKPGEMLFIPRWHWHFVAAIDECEAKEWFDRNGGCTSPESDHLDTTNLRKRKAMTSIVHTDEAIDSPTAQPVLPGRDKSRSQPEFSSSVSFWWGRRILKPDS